jgi:hypothetical protein
MPTLSRNEVTEKLVGGVMAAKPSILREIVAELFPEGKSSEELNSAVAIARHIKQGLESEEIVDLWNVVFPADRNVWYDEGDDRFHFNEEVVGYVEAD